MSVPMRRSPWVSGLEIQSVMYGMAREWSEGRPCRVGTRRRISSTHGASLPLSSSASWVPTTKIRRHMESYEGPVPCKQSNSKVLNLHLDCNMYCLYLPPSPSSSACICTQHSRALASSLAQHLTPHLDQLEVLVVNLFAIPLQREVVQLCSKWISTYQRNSVIRA